MTDKITTEAIRKQCAFYLPLKKRYCRMQASKGSEYCGEHFDFGRKDHSGEKKRIRCPLDPTHTVFEDNLKKHLKKCNAAKKNVHPCFSPGINSGNISYESSEEEKLPLSSIPTETLDDLIGRVEAVKSQYLIPIPTSILSHSALSHELENPQNGAFAIKHLSQQSSILANLAAHGLLEGETTFIEFGAGRGKLSHWIQRAMGENPTINYVLVDRSNCRHKMDLHHRFDTQGPKFHRLLMDIEDLDLRKLHVLNTAPSVVGVTKHLCGAGTDFALRCLVEQLVESSPSEVTRDEETLAPSPKKSRSSQKCIPNLKGIVFALCCHHRCTWESYVGAEFFSKELGLSGREFNLIRKMSSWAVCGQRRSKESHLPAERPHPSPEKPHPLPAKPHPLPEKPHTPAEGTCLSQNKMYSLPGKVYSPPDQPHPPPDEQHPPPDQPRLSPDGLHPPPDESHPPPDKPHPPPDKPHPPPDKPHPPPDKPHPPEHFCMKSEVKIDVGTHSNETDHKEPLQAVTNDSCDEHSCPVSNSNYIPHPREHIGLLCKHLIDSGRVWYLRQHGLAARLVYFIDRSVSLENVLLIATTEC